MGKIGRNEPCPCGSGKKFKKCCGQYNSHYIALPDDLKTGTKLDLYMELINVVMMYGQKIAQFEKDGKELVKTYGSFEKRYKPGTDGGINDSLFLNWINFDYRFGKSGETVCERLLQSPDIAALGEPGASIIKNMSQSYHAFYEIKGMIDNRIFLEELGSGAKWKMICVEEHHKEDIMPGVIWFVRFVGSTDKAYALGEPYIFDPDAKDTFKNEIEKHKKAFLEKINAKNLSDLEIFAGYCKDSLPFWIEYIFQGINMQKKNHSRKHMPALVNTDGEEMLISKVIFKIIHNEGLKERLTSLKNFDYNRDNNSWAWYKKGNKKISSFETTLLGMITIKDGCVVGETNSIERALRLKSKLMRAFGKYLSFEKIESHHPSALPPLTAEKLEEMDREQKELRANPEIRKLLRMRAEEYYHNDWLNSKIPALGNKTPFHAVKTADGKRRVEVILCDIEQSQKRDPDNPYRVNVDELRKKLGL